jgi:hypothetical protein
MSQSHTPVSMNDFALYKWLHSLLYLLSVKEPALFVGHFAPRLQSRLVPALRVPILLSHVFSDRSEEFPRPMVSQKQKISQIGLKSQTR